MTSEYILSVFREILRIPRESGHEEQIIEYLKVFADTLSLPCTVDKAGNVLITAPASPGMEDSPIVILQSHLDMVCEKKAGSQHDFSKDPINAVIENGWMIAKDTTLGADCGIGIATTLAILEDKEAIHGPLECLFTSSEETGMDGAFGLEDTFLKGKILINLDSEDEGELFIGCAGGIDTTAKFSYTPQPSNNENVKYTISLFGGQGGHSGDDINKNRSCAVKSLARILYRIMKETDTELCHIDAGNKRNAIAREANAVIGFAPDSLRKVSEIFRKTLAEIQSEYIISDPNIDGSFKKCQWEGSVIEKETSLNLISSLNGIPHGVLAMSSEIEGLVETSTNLASVKMPEEGVIRVGTSQRSSVDSAIYYSAEIIEAAFITAGAEVTHESEYPGWKPVLNSNILEITKESYRRLFNTEPVVRAIHAGLECGLFLTKYPNLDMISFGPTLRDVHTPGERLNLASLDKFQVLLYDVLKNIR